MSPIHSLLKTGSAMALAASFSLGPICTASAQTAKFVAANSGAISGEVSELSHVVMVQMPRDVILDIGAQQRTTLTLPSLSEIVINGQQIAPAQTPMLISIEPSEGTKGARVKAKGIMIRGKLLALTAEGDLIPSFVVKQKELNERVRSSMNLGAVLGNGIAQTMGTTILGQLGASSGDRTGVNLANQITSAGGLAGIMAGLLSGRGGIRIVEVPASSIHLLTIRDPAMVLAQAVQLNRELASGNDQPLQSITAQIRTDNSKYSQPAGQVDLRTVAVQQPVRQAGLVQQ